MSSKDRMDDDMPEGQPTQAQLIEMFQKRNLMKRAYDKAAEELKQTKLELEHLQRTSDTALKRLGALDSALADPENGINVVVLYQAEALWNAGNTVLAEQLARVRGELEAQEQLLHLQRFQVDQRERLTAAERAMKQAAAPHVGAGVEIEQVEKQIAASGAIWHYFKRKKLKARLAELEGERAALEAARRAAEEKVAKVRIEEAPKFPGLSVPARRTINLSLIAAAQYLYLEMVDDGVAPHIAKSHGTLAGEYTFGYTPDCLRLLKAMAEARGRVEKDGDRDKRVAARLEALQGRVTYKAETDTLPAPEALEQIDASIAPRAVAAGIGPKPVKPQASTSAFGEILGGDFTPGATGGAAIIAGNPNANVVNEDFCGLRSFLLD